MKLYTEEQVLRAMMLCTNQRIGFTTILQEHLTPIELPSDEEIDEKAFQVPYDNTKDFYDLQFIKGAKWMRDKIRGNE